MNIHSLHVYLEEQLSMESGKYLPKPAFQVLAVFENLMRIREDEETFLEIINKIDNYPGLGLSNFNIRRVLNARGSMTMTNVSVFKTTTVQIKEGDSKKKKTLNQSDKCWHTSLLNLVDYEDNRKLPAYGVFENRPEEKRKIDTGDLRKILKCGESLQPVLVYNLLNNVQYASRAVHKNGRGSGSSYREIHVMNSPMRIGCFYIESLARSIRKHYHQKGKMSNVMELKESDSIAASLFRKFKSKETADTYTFFDNADCSQWGPSRLAYSLYFSTAVRVPNKNLRAVLLASQKLFSNKIFKKPDSLSENIYDKVKANPAALDFINIARNSRIYNDVIGFLINPQGMGQGLEGNSSGLEQDDCLYLFSKYYQERSKFATEISNEFLNTSDDYSQFTNIKPNPGVKPRKAMSEHTVLTQLFQSYYGIVRNKKKSQKSQHKSEFNSVYRTVNGVYRAEIKIRNSFIDCPSDYDYSSMAVWAMEQSKEAIRAGAGYIGSSWIHTLNNHIVLKMGTMLKFCRQEGFDKIFKIPLETGGLIRVNPSRHLCLGKMYSICENYYGFDPCDPSIDTDEVDYYSKTIESVINGFSPDEYGDVIADEKIGDKIVRVKLPRLSKSGLINLSNRRSREYRHFEDFIRSIEPSIFLPLLRNDRRKTLLSVLLTIPQRMREDTAHSNSCVRMIMPQTPMDFPLYHLNCDRLKTIFDKEVVNRSEIIDLNRKYLSGEVDRYDIAVESSTFFDSNELKRIIYECNSQATDMKQSVKSSGVWVYELTYVNKRDFVLPYNRDISISGKREEQVSLIEGKLLPLCFGGQTDVHPYDFFSAMSLVKSKLEGFSINKGKLRLSSTIEDRDRGLFYQSIVCNFTEGMRLTCGSRKEVDVSYNVYRTLKRNLDLILYFDGDLTNDVSDIRTESSISSRRIDVTAIVSRNRELSEQHKDDLRRHLLRIYNHSYHRRELMVRRDDFTVSDMDMVKSLASTRFEYIHYRPHDILSQTQCYFRFSKEGRYKWTRIKTLFKDDFYTLEQYEGDVVQIQTWYDKPPMVEISLYENLGLLFMCLGKPKLKSVVCPLTTVIDRETTEVLIESSYITRKRTGRQKEPFFYEMEIEAICEATEEIAYFQKVRPRIKYKVEETVIEAISEEASDEEVEFDMMTDQEAEEERGRFNSFLESMMAGDGGFKTISPEPDEDDDDDGSSFTEISDPIGTSKKEELNNLDLNIRSTPNGLIIRLPYLSKLEKISHDIENQEVVETVYEKIMLDIENNCGEDVDFIKILVNSSIRRYLDRLR